MATPTTEPDKFHLLARCDSIHDFVEDARIYPKESTKTNLPLIRQEANKQLNLLPELSDATLIINDTQNIVKMMINAMPNQAAGNKRKTSSKSTSSITNSLPVKIPNFDGVSVGDTIYVLFYNENTSKQDVTINGDTYTNNLTKIKWYIGKITRINECTLDPDDYYRSMYVDIEFNDGDIQKNWRLEEDKRVGSIDNITTIDTIQQSLWFTTISEIPDTTAEYIFNKSSIGSELSKDIIQLKSLLKNNFLKYVEKTFTLKCKKGKKTIKVKPPGIHVHDTTFIITLQFNSLSIILDPFNYKSNDNGGWSFNKSFELSSEASESYVKKVYSGFLNLYYGSTFCPSWAYDNNNKFTKIVDSSNPDIKYIRIKKSKEVDGCKQLIETLGKKDWSISVDDTNRHAITSQFKNLVVTTATHWDSSTASQMIKKNVEYDSKPFPLESEKSDINKVVFKHSSDEINWDKLKISIQDDICTFETDSLNAIPVNTSIEYENGFEYKKNIFKTVDLLKHQICYKTDLTNVDELVKLTINDAMNIKRSGDGFQIIRASKSENLVLLSKDLLFFLQCVINNVQCINYSERDDVILYKLCHIDTSMLDQNNSLFSTKNKKKKQSGQEGGVVAKPNDIISLVQNFDQSQINEIKPEDIVDTISEDKEYDQDYERSIDDWMKSYHINANKLAEIHGIKDAIYQFHIILKYMELHNIYYGDIELHIDNTVKLNLLERFLLRDIFKYSVILKLTSKNEVYCTQFWNFILSNKDCDIEFDDIEYVIKSFEYNESIENVIEKQRRQSSPVFNRLNSSMQTPRPNSSRLSKVNSQKNIAKILGGKSNKKENVKRKLFLKMLKNKSIK
jgi:hypothetical protein